MEVFTVNDIITWNSKYNRSTYTFAIAKIKETNFTEEDAQRLEAFINDHPKDNVADQFNIEYMGHLTGEIKGNKDDLIFYINIFLNLN